MSEYTRFCGIGLVPIFPSPNGWFMRPISSRITTPVQASGIDGTVLITGIDAEGNNQWQQVTGDTNIGSLLRGQVNTPIGIQFREGNETKRLYMRRDTIVFLDEKYDFEPVDSLPPLTQQDIPSLPFAENSGCEMFVSENFENGLPHKYGRNNEKERV